MKLVGRCLGKKESWRKGTGEWIGYDQDTL